MKTWGRIVRGVAAIGLVAAMSAPPTALAADEDADPAVLDDEGRRRDRQPIRQCSPQEVAYLYGLEDDERSKNSGLSGLAGGLAEMMGQDWLKEGTEANKVAQQVYDFWTKEIGVSGAAAAGIMGNVYAESKFNPVVYQGGGEFDWPKGTTPKGGTGDGGGLYQFTPYTKYTNSEQFSKNGWEPDAQGEFVWESEFRSGVVKAHLPLVPMRSNGKRKGFPKMVSQKPDGTVNLDKNAWLTTSDPIEATATFQLAYERPLEYNGDREAAGIAADKVFNKDNFPGDAEKLEKALAGGDSALGGSSRSSALQSSTGVGAADEAMLFQSPCLDPRSGELIRDLYDAMAFKDARCTSTGSGGSGRAFTNNSKRDGRDGDHMYVNGVRIENWTRLRPKTQDLARDVAEKFGDKLEVIGGWRPVDDYPYHPGGYAADIMIPNNDEKLGTEIKDWVWDHYKNYNIYDTIWRQTWYGGPNDPGNPMEDRGDPTQNHFDHVHVTVDYADGPANESAGGGGKGSSNGKGSKSGRGCSSSGSSSKNSNISVEGLAIPAEGTLTSGVGPRWGTHHDGLDIANQLGTPIYAALDGTVKNAGPATGFGNWVVLDHGDGVTTVYGHMKTYSVKVGDKVKAGDEIAKIGSEGGSTGPHLHLELRKNGEVQDPVPFFQDNGYPDFPESEGCTVDLKGKGKCP